MPEAIARACAAWGCGNTEPCEVHTKERRASSRRFYTGTSGLNYGRRWRALTQAFLRRQEHVLCVACLKDGRTEAATQVDHIVPHRGDRLLFWDRANWQGLCRPCHSRKTAREVGFVPKR